MAFGKKNAESVGLLKNANDGQDDKSYTKYGTVRKNANEKSPISGLFRYASRADVALMSVGIICSAIHGSSFPVLALVFGQMTNIFIKQATVSSTKPIIMVTSTYDNPQTLFTTENNSLINVPLTIVGDAPDPVHYDPFFDSTYYNNNILDSNDLVTNSPLNGESSTFNAFFMSEMERLKNR